MCSTEILTQRREKTLSKKITFQPKKGQEMTSGSLLVHSARQIVQVVNNGERRLVGKAMKNIAILEQCKDAEAFGYSLVVNKEGKIAAIGTDGDIRRQYGSTKFDTVIDATGKTIIPGLVDGHTHAVWKGDRVHEFALKLAGATYMEVHAAGGGIHFTVDHVRNATVDELYTDFKHYAMRMLESGTTLAEVKSGYGLDTETELKMLQVLQKARTDPAVPIDISVTYCGPHAVPKGSTPAEATKDVLNNQLPALASKMASGELHVDNIDVFCEKGVFDVKQTRSMLEAGKKLGLKINFHGEEIHRLNSAEMGAELGATAISHLEAVSDEGIDAMAKAGTIATLLPTTAFFLRLTPPPARNMIDAGVTVALGSDFNPNAHCMAMPIVMYQACVLFRMSMPEVLAASTINAAASLGLAESHGSLEVGKWGDMIILDCPRWEHLIYQLGSYQYLISDVIKRGCKVH